MFNPYIVGFLVGLVTFFICLYFALFYEIRNSKFIHKYLFHISIVLISIALLLAVISPIFFTNFEIFDGDKVKDYGSVGDAIGGLMNPFIGIAAVIGTGLAFYVQYKANIQVQDQFKLQQFESQLFKMLDFHRDNIEKMSIENNNMTINGRKAVKFIVNQIESSISEITPFFKGIELKQIVNKEYHKILTNIKLKRPDINLKKLIIIDIAYTIVFVGVSNRDQHPFKRMLSKKYVDSFINNIFEFIVLKPANFSFMNSWNTMKKVAKSNLNVSELKIKWDNQLADDYAMDQLYNHIHYEDINYWQVEVLAYDKLKSNSFTKYYGGQQLRLGDYFRNLYQIYKLIDKNKLLDQSTKKDYSRIVRSQLSTIELYLFFYNSVSSFGHDWELSHLDEKGKMIITNYEILKNIPDVNIYNQINIPDYYPDIEYDFK